MIEMIVVLTIFSIIGGSLSLSFISGMKIWQRVRNIDFEQNFVFLNLEIFAKQLRQSIDTELAEKKGDAYSFSFPSIVNDSIVYFKYSFDPLSKEFLCKQIKLADMINQDTDIQDIGKKIFSAEYCCFMYFCFDPETELYLWTDTYEPEKFRLKGVKVLAKFENNELEKTIFIPNA